MKEGKCNGNYRCETMCSQESVQGERTVEYLQPCAENELVDEPGTFVLAWTTTPWTLPGNVALAVGSDLNYIEIVVRNQELGVSEKFILAKELSKD